MIYLIIVILFLLLCFIVGYRFDKKAPETDYLKVKINDYGKSISNVIIVSSLALFGISFYLLLSWTRQSDNIKSDINMVQTKALKKVIINEDNSSDNLNDTPIKLTDYEIFTNSSDLNISFDYLKNVNPNTVGWLKIENTNINYPIVKYTNNEYYLKHTFTDDTNNNGWIFMDYRNNPNDFDNNTIIYAHNLYNGSMFGTLKKALDANWINNEENKIVKFVTENYYSEWKIFSVYVSEPVTDYLQIKFDDNYMLFLETIKSKSIYPLEEQLTETDKILTFSTCNKSKRIVVHSKLIKLIEK